MWIRLGILAVLWFGSIQPGWAVEDFRLKLVTDISDTDDTLTWSSEKDNQEPPLQSKSDPKGLPIFYVTVKGKFKKKNGNLLYEDQNVATSSGGEFSLDVVIDSSQKSLSLLEVSETGEVTKPKISITFPKWEDWVIFQAAQKKRAQRRYNLSGALGFTLLSYTQTNFTNLTELVLTPKISGEYRLTALWDISANTYFNVFPLFTNPANAGMQFFGINLKGGFRIPSHTIWKMKVALGYYYASTITTSTGYGYDDLQGPEILFAVRRDFFKGNSLSGYLKFSTLFGGGSVIDLSNREFAAGAAYFFPPFKGGTSIGISVDAALLDLFYYFNGTSGQSRSLTLGVNYAL